jgi:hypothetical protein
MRDVKAGESVGSSDHLNILEADSKGEEYITFRLLVQVTGE